MFKTGTSGKTLSARFSSEADALGKAFDIKHPSRERYRLRYACIEGPEIGVYYRGRVKNEKVIIFHTIGKILCMKIVLPFSCNQLVLTKTLLSSVGTMRRSTFNPEVGCRSCFYHVYAERKDVNPLIVEYEGNECFDYPDPNYKPGDNPNYKDPEYLWTSTN